MTIGNLSHASENEQIGIRKEIINSAPAEALAGFFNLGLPHLNDGDFLPPLWHWIYLLEKPAQRIIGPDGHPTIAIPSPPAQGQSRMFAGGRVNTHSLLTFGKPATRTTRVIRSEVKEGKSGPLTFVTVSSKIEQEGKLRVEEESDIVYREMGATPKSAIGIQNRNEEPEPKIDGSLEFAIDPVVLFRFSALTYNSHRIHYDLPYALEEGYPDLVIHGPLQAMLMGECARRSGITFLSKQFAYRLVKPAFGAQRLLANSFIEDSERKIQVKDETGQVTATSSVKDF